jgi:psp operon transcriptional activator
VIDPFDSPFRPKETKPALPSSADATGVPTLPLDFKATVQNFEVDLLERGLAEARFNQRKAAELLGLTYDQLRGYLKKYDLLKARNAG